MKKTILIMISVFFSLIFSSVENNKFVFNKKTSVPNYLELNFDIENITEIN